MRELRGEEEWARTCIGEALGAEVESHDDGSEPKMFDLRIRYPDGRQGAVEVTAAADTQSIELWNLVNGGGRWIEPGIEGGWSVVLLPRARAKRLKSELPAFLSRMEREGIKNIRVNEWHPGPYDFEASRLGITYLFQGGTDYPGSIYPTIELPGEKAGGMVPTEGEPLPKWISAWVAAPEQRHNLEKLSAAEGERHLFIILPGFADAPFEVTDLLTRDGAPLPTEPPNLPEVVTHIWCVSTWNSGAGIRWSPERGWEHFSRTGSG